MVVHFVKHIGKVGRAVEIDVLEASLVTVDNFLNAVDTWVEDVSVHGEAVTGSRWVGRHSATKAIQVDEFVAVVVLEDVSHG